VVCGIKFDSVNDLDALLLGVYWDLVRDKFPHRQVQPALSDSINFAMGAIPMRAFLTSANNEFVLQLQYDRFIMNWRAVGEAYPRFSDRHGPKGLLSRMEEEFGLFSTFVKGRCGVELVPVGIELAKIDVLEQGKHWTDYRDLASVLPVVGAFDSLDSGVSREFNMQFVQHDGGGALVTNVQTGKTNEGVDLVRIDGRVISNAHPIVREAFKAANTSLNQMFFRLIAHPEKLFGLRATDDANG